MALPLDRARAKIGLKSPFWEAKQAIWKHVSVPTAQIVDGYIPSKTAAKAHNANTRYIGLSGGWRSGKSLWSAMEGVTWLPFAQLIWIVGQDYDMTRQEFIYLSEAAISTGLARDKDVHLSLNKYSPCVMKSINGCVVETRTLADFRKLASKAPDLVILCEPGLIANLKQVMELVSGRVAEKRGCVIAAGTSDESSEEWYELWDRWQRLNAEGGKSFAMPSWENLHRFPGGRGEEEFAIYEEVYGAEALNAHYGGVPAAPRDLVLRNVWNEAIHVIKDQVWQPGLPTEIAIDPNYSAPNAYSVEVIQWDIGTGQIFLVDEVAESGLHHDAIKDICRQREWWPHIQGGTIDPFAEGSPYGNPAPVSYWVPLRLRYNIRPYVNTTVQAIKEALALNGTRPRMTVSPNCKRFIKEAKLWRVDKYGRPQKTWCDAMKATGYWLVDRFGDERSATWNGDDGDDNIVRASDWVIE